MSLAARIVPDTWSVPRKIFVETIPCTLWGRKGPQARCQNSPRPMASGSMENLCPALSATAPAKPGRQGEQFLHCSLPQARQALHRLLPRILDPDPLLLYQPPVTLRDTSTENLRNQGHTGRKPPSQPSNPAGHLAADWARSAGQRRGTTWPQNPQPGLGDLQAPLPGSRNQPLLPSLPTEGSALTRSRGSQSRRKAPKGNPVTIHQGCWVPPAGQAAVIQ